MEDAKEGAEGVKEESKEQEKEIRTLEDYDMAELGLNEVVLDHLKKLPPFEFKTNGDFDGELEWRPTHKRRILAGDLIYQGQWVKGTMIKQGFGRRVHTNLNAS